MGKKRKMLNPERITPTISKKLVELERNPCVQNIFCLLETHLKPRAETPSSVIVKTDKKNIYPFYSSNSMNCGMGLLQTNIDAADAEAHLHEIMRELDKRTTLSQFERFFLPKEISTAELRDILLKGVDAMPTRYRKLNDAFELHGNLFKGKKVDESVLRHIPRFLWRGGRSEIGKNAGGNHFIELQEVEKIYKKIPGLTKGKLFVMVHLGTGFIGDNITGVYCHRQRKRNQFIISSIIGPRFFLFKKTLYLWRKYGFRFLLNNFRLLFRNDRLDRGIRYESQHGEDFLLAETATMNYGYAWRHIVYSKVWDILEETIGKNVKAKLLMDRSHNSIYIKEKSIYYTRNSCMIEPGSNFILPGDATNHSYLCKAGPKLKEVEYSIDHGLGELLKKDLKKRKTGKKVLRYKRRRYIKLFGVQHKEKELEDSGMTLSFLKEMEKKGYLTLICRLRPIANLK